MQQMFLAVAGAAETGCGDLRKYHRPLALIRKGWERGQETRRRWRLSTVPDKGQQIWLVTMLYSPESHWQIQPYRLTFFRYACVRSGRPTWDSIRLYQRSAAATAIYWMLAPNNISLRSSAYSGGNSRPLPAINPRTASMYIKQNVFDHLKLLKPWSQSNANQMHHQD